MDSATQNLPTRVVLFGHMTSGFSLFFKLLSLHKLKMIEFVGVSVINSNANNEFKTVLSSSIRNLLKDAVETSSVPWDQGSTTSSGFMSKFQSVWKPDLCFVTPTFTQKIPQKLVAFPKLGFAQIGFQLSQEQMRETAFAQCNLEIRNSNGNVLVSKPINVPIRSDEILSSHSSRGKKLSLQCDLDNFLALHLSEIVVDYLENLQINSSAKYSSPKNLRIEDRSGENNE